MMDRLFPDRTTRSLFFLTLLGLLGMILYQQFSGPGLMLATNDHDSWARLARIDALLEHGNWYDKTLAHDDYPHGALIPWTRVVDVLMLILAAPFRLFTGSWDTALQLAGAGFNAILLSVTLVAMLAIVRPFAQGPYAARFLLLAAMLHPLLGRIFAPGVVDHHALLATCLAVQLACWVHGRDRAMGLVAGLGIWISPEFVLPGGVVFAGAVLRWLATGESLLGLRQALSATLAVLCAALVIERPFESILAVEYDTLSIVHVGLIAFAWMGIAILNRAVGDAAQRVLAAGIAAAMLGGVMFTFFPLFWMGPLGAVSPEMREIFLRHIAESKPVYLTQGPWLLAAWYFSLISIPSLLKLPDDTRKTGWLMAAGLVLFAAMMLVNGRWYGYLMILSIPALALLLDGVFSKRGSPVLVAMGFLMAVMYPLLFAAMALKFNTPPVRSFAPECEQAISEAIMQDYPSKIIGTETKLVLVEPNHGTEMLYFTPHGSLSWNMHRNAHGYSDAFHVFSARHAIEAQTVVRKRGAALMIACMPQPDAASNYPFLSELAHTAPDWMEEIKDHPWVEQGVHIYRLERAHDS